MTDCEQTTPSQPSPTHCFTLQWHITHRCNLHCTHCYQEDRSAFAERGAMDRVLDQFDALLELTGCRGHVNVTGGEPLTHPELFGLLRRIRERGHSFALLTNGTLIGREEARLLKSLGASYVQVSLDGMRKTHDAIRGAGAFDAAVDGLCRLLREDVDATVAFTAQSENRRQLPALAVFCRDLGVRKLWYDRVVIPADRDEKSLSLTAKQARRLMRTGARLQRSCPVTNQRALQFRRARPKQIYRCEAGRHLLALLADGTVMPCRRLPIPVGNVLETDLCTIWRTAPTLQALREETVPSDCEGCRYAESCRGGARCIAYAKTGRWDLRDPDCGME